jgi:hypothetical protein
VSDLKQLLIDSKGLPSAFRKTHPIGTVWGGKITKVSVQQARDDDGNPDTWDDGNPKQQVVVAIQTDQRDPERLNDDGVRGVYVKWWGEQKKAFRECIEKAGVDDLEVGGLFAAKYTGEGPQPANRMYSPAKLMQYEYKAPTGLGGLLNGNGAAPGVATVQDATVAAATRDPWGPANPGMAAAAAADQAAAAAQAQQLAAQALLTTQLGAVPIAGQGNPSVPPPPVAAVPVAAPAAPADPGDLLATVKGLIALGMTDDQIIAAVPAANPAALTALRALPA